MNFLPGTVTRGADGGAAVGLGGAGTMAVAGIAAAPDDRITLGIRPHHIRLVAEGAGGVAAEVRLVEALGSETILHAKTPDGQHLLAVLSGQKGVAAGERVYLRFDPGMLHVFDRSGLRLEPDHPEPGAR